MINNELKLVIFSDLHYLDPDHKEWSGRKLTWLAEPLLYKLFEKVEKIRPDACIFLGDHIEDTGEGAEKDMANLQFVRDMFSACPVPLYAIPGNHDLFSAYSREKVEDIMGYGHSTFSIDLKGYHLIFLGLDLRPVTGEKDGGISRTQFISTDDMRWLERDIWETNGPCILFNHFGIAEDNMCGNWWFKSCPETALLANRGELKEILRVNKEKILGMFCGHQHRTKFIDEDDIKYCVVGSLTESIENDGKPDGMYMEVTIKDSEMQVMEKHLRLQ